MLLVGNGLRVEPDRALAVFLLWAITALGVRHALDVTVSRRARIIRDLIEGVSLFGLVSLLGAVASYPLAMGHHAFVDGALEHIDRDLHFDWPRLYILVASHPWLQTVERWAYQSIFVTPALIIACFAVTGRRAECRLFVATFWIAVVMTLSLFPLLPAAGPFATLWHGPAPYMPQSALYRDQVLSALRDHSLRTIRLGELHGLVCAPSFHAASAVIYGATAFRIRRLRWPIGFLNIAMLAATPIEGTHYLADLIGGLLVALFALRFTPAILARVAARHDGTTPKREWATAVAAE